MSNSSIRKSRRSLRHNLDSRQRRAGNTALCRNICRHPAFHAARRIGVYIASDGEVDLSEVIERAWQRGKQTFVPVLAPVAHRRLWFTPLKPETALLNNRFGIDEPDRREWQPVKPMALDLVITPLVAYTDRGERLGMGCGYYDRTFQFLHRRIHWRRPVLLGAAYSLQRVTHISTHQYDVPLDAIATENELHFFVK